MGEVYRAEDTRLDREVAIKVLPEAFVAEPDRLTRFQREAKVLASLNHPNIAGIHEVGEEAGTHFLVMELVQGETLAARLDRGPLPLDDALQIALLVARGLEAAHERGVVHRDLKPGNVMVDPRGGVKILDFGLAKALEPDPGSAPEVAHSPTLTYQATVAGVLMGTAAYMSPEQARGETADRRSDVWSFGVLLWEMLVGRRLFEGPTTSDTLAGILRDQIDVSALPESCPAPLRRLLRRCLQRDPDRRLHDVADARIVIQEVVEGVESGPEPGVAGPVTPAARATGWMTWLLAAALLLAVLASGWLALQWRGEVRSRGSVRAQVLAPEGTRFEFADQHVGSLAVDPDGRRLAFTAVAEEDRSRMLYVRALDSTTAGPLAGTEGATFPFWSPDGRYIAFFATGKLRKIDASGGAALAICDAPDGRGGTWNREGVIVFSPSPTSPLYRVSAGGGEATAVTRLDPSRHETTHRHPSFLPDGRRFLYTGGGYGGEGSFAIYVGRLDSPERRRVADVRSNAVFSQGHLLYLRDGFLMAQPFDADRAEATGEPTPIADTVFVSVDMSGGTFSASPGGTLAFYPEDVSDLQLTLMNSEGRELGPIGEPGSYRFIRLSPDGGRLAVTFTEASQNSSDIWILDLGTGSRTRLTFDPRPDSNPVWSPDGSRIAYSGSAEGRNDSDIFVRPAAGGGEPELLLGTEAGEEPWDWSPDGRYLLFNRSEGSDLDLWVLPLDGEEPFPLVEGEASEGWGHFSPDGRWVAYVSNAAGPWQLFATRFPQGDGRWQLTSDTEGGYWIVDWVDDGRGIYHVTSDQMLSVLEVRLRESSIEGGRRTRLMPIGGEFSWTVSGDGRRIVIGKTEGEAREPSLTLVTNWPAGLQ